MTFKFSKLAIPDVVLIEPAVYEDHRGFFAETYKASEFKEAGLRFPFVQDNHSYSKGPVLRGLHYQHPPAGIGKLVRVIDGEIFDVAVDIRKGSPTFGKYVSEILSSKNQRQLYVPVGFAHGLVILSETAHVLYKMTGEFSKAHDTGILWNDPDLGIRWPIQEPILSEKDTQAKRLKDVETGFIYKVNS